MAYRLRMDRGLEEAVREEGEDGDGYRWHGSSEGR